MLADLAVARSSPRVVVLAAPGQVALAPLAASGLAGVSKGFDRPPQSAARPAVYGDLVGAAGTSGDADQQRRDKGS